MDDELSRDEPRIGFHTHSSGEHDPHMTKEDIDRAIKKAIDAALRDHRPKTDIKVIATIILSSLALLGALWTKANAFSNNIAIIEERQHNVILNSAKLSDRLDANEALLHNNESAISQTSQRLTDHIDTDNDRWKQVGGKREHQ